MEDQALNGNVDYPNAMDSDLVEVAEYKVIHSHFELKVFQLSERLANDILSLSRAFPREELYSLTSQIRDSSRSVAASISEAWRRRRYPASFINKLSETEAEAAETQTWLGFARHAEYIETPEAERLIGLYEQVLSMLVSMQRNSDVWTKNVGYESRPLPKKG